MSALAIWLVALYAVGAVGILAHQGKRWYYMPDPPPLGTYFDHDMVRYMIGTMLFRYTGLFTGFVGGAAALGGAELSASEIYASVVAVFGLGFGADSSRDNSSLGETSAPEPPQ